MTKEEFADRVITHLTYGNSIEICPIKIGLPVDKVLCLKGCKNSDCWQKAITEAGLIKEEE